MRYRAVVLALAVFALSAGVAAAFSQLSGPAGCVSETGAEGCSDAKAIDEPYDLVLSPDGRYLYSGALTSDAVAVFGRNTDGKLVQLALQNGCVSETGTGGECADGYGLDGANGLALSPDGQNLYSAQWTGGSVAAFSRDATTGVLAEIGCISETGSGGDCADGNTLDHSYPITVSPDGENVYVASYGTPDFFTPLNDGIAIFSRDPGTGALTQLPGAQGCLSETGSGCADGYGFGDPYRFAWSPDGEFLYLSNYTPGTVQVFHRDDVTGLLTEVSCVSNTGADGCADVNGIGGANGLAISEDGAFLYVAAFKSVAAFRRDPATGALTQLSGADACITQGTTVAGCTPGRALNGGNQILIGKDGSHVYVATQYSDAVTLFTRNKKTGALRQIKGKQGCASQNGTDGTGGPCMQGRGLDGAWGLTRTAEGKYIYVSADVGDAISVFKK